MSRSTQFYGLNPRAEKFIKDKALHTELKVCEVCGHETGGKPIVGYNEDVKGMFGETVCTLRWFFSKYGDHTFEEYIQDEPWDSGPMIFLALRWCCDKLPIKESLWTDKEMGIDGIKEGWTEEIIE